MRVTRLFGHLLVFVALAAVPLAASATTFTFIGGQLDGIFLDPVAGNPNSSPCPTAGNPPDVLGCLAAPVAFTDGNVSLSTLPTGDMNNLFLLVGAQSAGTVDSGSLGLGVIDFTDVIFQQDGNAVATVPGGGGIHSFGPIGGTVDANISVNGGPVVAMPTVTLDPIANPGEGVSGIYALSGGGGGPLMLEIILDGVVFGTFCQPGPTNCAEVKANFTFLAVPEPASVALLAGVAVGLASRVRRR